MAKKAKNSPDVETESQQAELRERVLFSLFLPAVRMAQRYKVPLKPLTNALELAYFHQMRDTGLKMREIAPIFDVGMRKVAELSKELKSIFFEPERAEGLPRRIEHMLWAQPLSKARMVQTLGFDEDEVQDALDILVEQERVVVEETTRKNGTQSRLFSVSKKSSRLVGNSVHSRIDGLNWLLRSMANIVESRFFSDEDKAFARVLTVHMTKEDRERLERVYQDVLWPLLAEMDQKSEEDEDAETVDLVFAFGPRGPMQLGNDE